MRLTQKIKEQIVRNVVKATLNKRREKLEKDRVAFGNVVYSKLFGQYAELLNGAPDGFFKEQSSVKVKFGDQVHEVTFDRKPVPESATGFRTYHLFSHGHSLTKHFIRLDRRCKKLREDQRELETSVRATLGQITTDKKLLEIWPEVEKYLPEKSRTENLPAVPVASLNTMIAALSAAE